MDKVQIHKEICEELNKMYAEKNKRYGDSFAKVRWELGRKVILVRLMDKLERLKTLLNNLGTDNLEESIEDTLLDLANYAIMEVIERRGTEWREVWKDEASKTNQ